MNKLFIIRSNSSQEKTRRIFTVFAAFLIIKHAAFSKKVDYKSPEFSKHMLLLTKQNGEFVRKNGLKEGSSFTFYDSFTNMNFKIVVVNPNPTLLDIENIPSSSPTINCNLGENSYELTLNAIPKERFNEIKGMLNKNDSDEVYYSGFFQYFPFHTIHKIASIPYNKTYFDCKIVEDVIKKNPNNATFQGFINDLLKTK